MSQHNFYHNVVNKFLVQRRLLWHLYGPRSIIFLFWRVFVKAGLSGPLSLLAIIPGFGPFIALCVLAFSRWRVTPVAEGYASGTGYIQQPYPPAYPTTVSSTTYPPPAYPPVPPPGDPTERR